MRPQKVLDKEILISLSKVFRDKGYEGASLQELAEATGLKKASLYHRFPKGKYEMAKAVFTHIDHWVEENIFLTLKNESNTPEKRLKDGLTNIKILYDEGKETCVFNSFSTQTGLSLFEQSIKNSMIEWINSFTEIGLALNIPSKESKEYALETLIEIQGSLIVAKGLNDISVFAKTLKNIELKYLRGQL
ncbi:TetR/AcrR family transcriptional regulator [Polaribacter sargassicola]|uniref:TetR/AcrR family transcriptional regulator n=1 Tax=Polaribacter sargassicola TaxID=2836891 RepID=UPI001F26AFF4|nr:TetR/AcrR family transcriptional regulator [Polaribacter sp. DS7-9]MCG1037141.1 TetR/AcrR family transcriptional regulator [Polaribacter sp. DS7-9]